MPLTSSATQTLSQNGHHPLLSRYRVSIGATGAGLAGCEPRRSLICSQLGAGAAAAVMVGAGAARRVAIATRGPLWLHARLLLMAKPRAVGASGTGQKACAHDAMAESTSTTLEEVIYHRFGKLLPWVQTMRETLHANKDFFGELEDFQIQTAHSSMSMDSSVEATPVRGKRILASAPRDESKPPPPCVVLNSALCRCSYYDT